VTANQSANKLASSLRAHCANAPKAMLRRPQNRTPQMRIPAPEVSALAGRNYTPNPLVIFDSNRCFQLLTDVAYLVLKGITVSLATSSRDEAFLCNDRQRTGHKLHAAIEDRGHESGQGTHRRC
jgi:hypothetical protein